MAADTATGTEATKPRLELSSFMVTSVAVAQQQPELSSTPAIAVATLLDTLDQQSLSASASWC